MSMDLESAMANVYADTSSESGHTYTYYGSQKQFEFEDQNGEICWVEFRVGHVGDAVSLASLFSTIVKKCKAKSTSSLIKESSSCSKYNDYDENEDNYSKEEEIESNDDQQDLDEDVENNTGVDPDTDPNLHTNDISTQELAVLQEDKEHEEEEEDGEVEEDCSQLELRLADGFGDEQNPPAFHAILVEVCRLETITVTDHEQVTKGEGGQDSEKKTETAAEVQSPPSPSSSPIATCTSDDITKELCGAAIITIDWDAHRNLRCLRVEELEVDSSKVPSPDLVLRRLILSLSAIALKTGCDGLVMKEAMFPIAEHDASTKIKNVTDMT